MIYTGNVNNRIYIGNRPVRVYAGAKLIYSPKSDVETLSVSAYVGGDSALHEGSSYSRVVNIPTGYGYTKVNFTASWTATVYGTNIAKIYIDDDTIGTNIEMGVPVSYPCNKTIKLYYSGDRAYTIDDRAENCGFTIQYYFD